MKKIILKNQKELIMRKAVKEDAKSIMNYMYAIASESDYLSFGVNELETSVEKEQEIIESITSKDNSIFIVAVLDGDIAGAIVFRGGERKRLRHAGEFGLSVRKPYWDLGIGNSLLELLIEWAKDTGIVRKINLKSRTDNEKAIKLYKKYGFKEEGILVRDLYIAGSFYDSLLMGLLID